MTTVERPYYANGRRLAAGDLRLEQHYQIAMRRMLNRGQFTAGVMSGLEVSRVDATHVRVAPGLALDPAGREIVLPDGPDGERTLAVPAQPPVTSLGGYFLVARYAEDRVTGDDGPCGSVDDATARVREHAELLWTETYPAPDLCDPLRPSVDCAIVLAFVNLTNACEIGSIEIGVRQFAHPTHVSQTSAYALEGEKDLDQANPKVLHFHVRGGAANSITLFLWGDKFSSIYYTELGKHAHTMSGVSISPSAGGLTGHKHDLSHSHGLPDTKGNGEGVHTHAILIRASMDHVVTGNPLLPFPDTANQRYIVFNSDSPHQKWVQDSDPHWHSFSSNTDAADPTSTGDPTSLAAAPQHPHTFSATIDPSGNATDLARGGAPYRYFAELKVELDGTDITPQIADRLPSVFQRQLGNGQATHPIVREGAGPLDLLEIAGAAGRTLDVGPHTLTFRLDRPPDGSANGGNLHYNLYVE
jgi:hypothetical protein